MELSTAGGGGEEGGNNGAPTIPNTDSYAITQPHAEPTLQPIMVQATVYT